MPMLFCGPMESHSSWTGIHLQCWLGHMQFTTGADQSLLLSHDWYVRRSLCPPPPQYTGQIHLGRSCGCWWNLRLISMVIFSHCFWDNCASLMEFCTCLTPFISLTSSLKLTWLHFSHYLTCIRRTRCPYYCAWQSVPVLWREHQIVVVVNHCFTSLFGTKSGNVIR